jgi:hypothetical protein
MKMTICDGLGKPIQPKQYHIFEDNYELDVVDKAIAYLTGFVLLGGILIGLFGG